MFWRLLRISFCVESICFLCSNRQLKSNKPNTVYKYPRTLLRCILKSLFGKILSEIILVPHIRVILKGIISSLKCTSSIQSARGNTPFPIWSNKKLVIVI
ncbi:hypothetical protein KP509_13G030300 [Ceratopteris richardii]|uniref:Uncharacterized protein n=1 Tax=Ceratopteris richardii TaxID=49495 RepID=A0A8T2TEF5_CERRI|nr:hypothetical protein KP509_13G030300 [Ceratopteris richardii]